MVYHMFKRMLTSHNSFKFLLDRYLLYTIAMCCLPLATYEWNAEENSELCWSAFLKYIQLSAYILYSWRWIGSHMNTHEQPCTGGNHECQNRQKWDKLLPKIYLHICLT